MFKLLGMTLLKWMKRELLTDYLVMVCEGHDFITVVNHIMQVVKNYEKRFILH